MEPDSVQFCTIIRPDTVPDCDPAWKTETVLALARGIVEKRAFDRMPILADALEEVGCQDIVILLHARSTCQHRRDCWLLNWVLKGDAVHEQMVVQRQRRLEKRAEQEDADLGNFARRNRYWLLIRTSWLWVPLLLAGVFCCCAGLIPNAPVGYRPAMPTESPKAATPTEKILK